MKITTVYRQEQFTFDSTGKTIEPVCGVWGLGTDLLAYSGFDNEHDVIAPGAGRSIDMLTPAEAVELGEYMAAQWRAFADKHRAAAVDQADDKRLTPTEALRAGMVTVDDFAGIGERIAAAFPSTEEVFGRTVVCCGQCGSDKATKRAIDGMIVCDKCGAWTEEG